MMLGKTVAKLVYKIVNDNGVIEIKTDERGSKWKTTRKLLFMCLILVTQHV